MSATIGELFAGYGGLALGVQQVIGSEVIWFSEFDPAPSKILAHHWPAIPNLGDITQIDWATVEPVDILTGGFPCTDVSLAGARAGLNKETRSGLWLEFAKAIDALKPSLVIIENVRGLLSAKTTEDIDDAEDSDLEQFEGSVGEPVGGDRPILNAFGRVLGDLAELGYDAEWVGVRAADACAPHGRFRVFILAHAKSIRRNDGHVFNVRPASGEGNIPIDSGDVAGRSSRTQAPTENAHLAIGDQRRQSAPGQTQDGRSRADAGGRSRTPTPDTDNPGCSEPRRPVTVRTEQSPAEHNRSHALTNPSGERFREHPREPSAEETRQGSGDLTNGVSGSRTATDWGPYRPAIERWEQVLGRPAPSPTLPDGKNGAHRLSAVFVEFMMGLPLGHVTNPAIGLTRNQQLKALGNGVVPQQAALALSLLLSREEVTA